MRVFLFSGQGSQKEGMAASCLSRGPAAAAVYETMSAICGRDIAAFTAEDLKSTTATQLAVIAYSLALWESVAAEAKRSSVLAGFSLGEYSALGAAGVLTLADLTRLITARCKAMEKAVSRGENLGMAAVVGLDSEAVEAMLAAWDGPAVYAVNYNSPTQTVLSGDLAAIDSLTPELKNRGARRVLRLAVADAFHSPYMEEAADELEQFARTLTYAPPRFPLYSNLDGRRLDAGADFDWPTYLKTTLVSPVRFVDELRRLHADGISSYVECGPGKTLQGLVSQTLEGVEIMSALDLPVA